MTLRKQPTATDQTPPDLKSRDEVERELSDVLIEIRDRVEQRRALRSHTAKTTGGSS